MKNSFLITLLAGLLISSSLSVAKEKKPKFDGLDGKGPSGVRVDLIAWDGNLEIHVYPKGKIAGLGFVIDNKSKEKALVISYRFKNTSNDEPIIRRSLLENITEGFNVFVDNRLQDKEMDKFILTNKDLTKEKGKYVLFKKDAPPAELYPKEYKEELAAFNKAKAEESVLGAPAEPAAPARELSKENPKSAPEAEENSSNSIKNTAW
jgi:hypothetical protein